MSGINEKLQWQHTTSWETEEKIIDMVNTLDGKRVFLLTDKQKVQIFSIDGNHLGNIPVAPGVSHIQLSPTGDKLYLFDTEKNYFSAKSLSFQQKIDTTNAPSQGKENAPISIVVFTDFECPFCAKLPQLLDEVLKNNPENVQLFFKNMPLTSIHKMAEGAARAAIAAKNQGKFWPYHDKLFAAKKLSTEKLQDFAKELKLDIPQFNEDMFSQETTNTLQNDMYAAQRAGVEGTPSIFINGWPLSNRSIEGFQAMIDSLLEQK